MVFCIVFYNRGCNKLKTTVTKRFQTVIPASIRKRYSIQGGDRLEWIDDGQIIKVIVIPKDPIGELRGCARGEKLVERLLQTRRKDRDSE